MFKNVYIYIASVQNWLCSNYTIIQCAMPVLSVFLFGLFSPLVCTKINELCILISI